MIGDTRYDFSWTKNSVTWDDVDISYQIANISQEADNSRFKNYYRDYVDCHKIVIITYPKRILFYKMKQRIEFKGSYSRKHQRPRKLRGQRLF